MDFLIRIILSFSMGTIFLIVSACGNEHRSLREFPINFVVLSSKTEIRQAVDLEAVKKEIEILNTNFVTEDRTSLVRFRFKSFHSYEDIANSGCEFIRLGDFTGTYNSGYWQELFNSCDDPRVVDPTAINFYIYDSYSPESGFDDKGSHGKNNLDRPYVILDWERLNHRIQSPEEHEMGHAFGLSHACLPGAKPDTSTNIMASRECGRGSGGKRDIGFNPQQSRIILRNADEISEKLMLE